MVSRHHQTKGMNGEILKSFPSNVVADIWTLHKHIGEGTFGSVFEGKFHGKKVAIKFERATAKRQQLLFEYQMMRYIYFNSQKMLYSPTPYEYLHNCNGWNILIMSLHGQSLQNLLQHKSSRRKLQTSKAATYGVAMIRCIENLHSLGFIHRDIKPHNFLSSLYNHDVFIADFGLACRYLQNGSSAHHIEVHDKAGIVGTIRYISINIHNCLRSSRRDDLISIGYIMASWVLGYLPWDSVSLPKTRESKAMRRYYQKVLQIKQTYPLHKILNCKKFAKFNNFLKYCEELAYDATPDYNLLISMLEQH